MNLVRIEKENKEYKVVNTFCSDGEIATKMVLGYLDPFLVNAETLEHDRYTLNVSGIPVITDEKEKVIVACGYSKINEFMKENNLVSIVDIIELEN